MRDDTIISHNYIHVIFSTWNQAQVFTDSAPWLVQEALKTILVRAKCKPIEIACEPDHVHIVLGLNDNLSVDGIVNKLKDESINLIRPCRPEWHDFKWQESYGAFTVGLEDLGRLGKSLRRQKDYHREVSYKDEFREILRAHQLEWDEKELWE